MAMAESKGLSYDLTLLCAHPKNSYHIRVGPNLLAKVILMRIVAGLGLKYTDMSPGSLAGLLNSKGKLRHMFHVGGHARLRVKRAEWAIQLILSTKRDLGSKPAPHNGNA